MVEAAYFQDAYSASLRCADARIVDIFFAIFGHHPAWLNGLLIVRNSVATLCGLEAPTASEMRNVRLKDSYRVGEKIGVWPIFLLSETELIAGRDNKHLDFRLSVFREHDGEKAEGTAEEGARVVVSTLCTVHNGFGKIYLFFIVPFHKWGVQRLMAKAIAANRL